MFQGSGLSGEGEKEKGGLSVSLGDDGPRTAKEGSEYPVKGVCGSKDRIQGDRQTGLPSVQRAAGIMCRCFPACV